MDHGAVIRASRRATGRIALVLFTLLALPAAAQAADAVTPSTTGATLVAPAEGEHFDHLELATMVQFDPSTDSAGVRETPRWVLLATDAGMTKTVRYCRQFVWASTGAGDTTLHWGCNRWATGADQAGNDQLQPLEEGTVYYWQVVSKSNVEGGADILSAVRAFAIDAKPTQGSIADVSNKVVGTAFDDGTQLNLGAAALVNSGVRVSKIYSTRLGIYAYRIHVRHQGTIDGSRSYIKVRSAAGTRYLKVRKADGKVWALWRLTTKERRLKTKRFTYQSFLKSATNGAMVKSPPRVVLIKPKPKAKAPAWTPDR
jgi:hypothetical protein